MTSTSSSLRSSLILLALLHNTHDAPPTLNTLRALHALAACRPLELGFKFLPLFVERITVFRLVTHAGGTRARPDAVFAASIGLDTVPEWIVGSRMDSSSLHCLLPSHEQEF